VLGHEVLTYGSVDETANDIAGVNVRKTLRCCNVIKCTLVGIAYRAAAVKNVIRPCPDT
jgi:hypothetical protein